ncbi:MAG: heavy-metal-associated domain-containing protein [Caldimonas sp.]
MITYEVEDMTCGHCVSTITKALKSADKDARVTIDLPNHRVHIESASADPKDLADAIEEAGYSPRPVSADGAKESAPKAGGCCGCG